MNRDSADLEASYAYCRRMAREAGSNFYGSFFMLRREKRIAMDALYAFMRHTDDLGDSSDPLSVRQAALAQWRADVTAALAGQLNGAADRSVLPALADTAERFQIPSQYLLAVLDGLEMDMEGRRYETFDELAEYCRAVASAVGMACLHIWGCRDEEALEPADRCGLAFQLTNILRDLREDVLCGRVYLPLEEFRRFDYSEEDLAAGVADARFHRLMGFQLDRAEQFYRESVRLFDYLQADGQRMFGMMTAVYHRILSEIRKAPDAVLERRVSLGWLEKARIAARWLVLPPRRPTLS